MEVKRNNSIDLFLARQSLQRGRPCHGWREHMVRNTVVESYDTMSKDEEEEAETARRQHLLEHQKLQQEHQQAMHTDPYHSEVGGDDCEEEDNNTSFRSCASDRDRISSTRVPLVRRRHMVRRNLLRPSISKDISSTFTSSISNSTQHPHYKNKALSSRVDHEATLISKFVAAWDFNSSTALYNLMFTHGEDMFDPSKPNSLSSFIALGGIDLFGRLLCSNAPFLSTDVDNVVQGKRRDVANKRDQQTSSRSGGGTGTERSRKLTGLPSVGDVLIKFPDVADTAHTKDTTRYSALMAPPVLTTGKRDADGAFILIVPPPNVAASPNQPHPHDRSSFVNRSISVINFMVRVITEVVVCSTPMGWYLFEWAEGALLERLMALSQCSYIRDGALILIEHILSVVGPALHFESSPQLRRLLRENVQRLSAAVEALHRITVTNASTTPPTTTSPSGAENGDDDNDEVDLPINRANPTEVYSISCAPETAKDSRLVLGLKQLIEEEEVTLASLCRVLSLAVIAGIMSEAAQPQGSPTPSKDSRGFARRSTDLAGSRRMEAFPQCLTRIDMTDAMMASNVWFLIETPHFVPCILRVLEKGDDQSSVRIFRGNRTLTLVSDEATGDIYGDEDEYEEDYDDGFGGVMQQQQQGEGGGGQQQQQPGMNNLLQALQTMLQGGGGDGGPSNETMNQLLTQMMASGQLGGVVPQQMQQQQTTPLMPGMVPAMNNNPNNNNNGDAAAGGGGGDTAQRLQEMADGITADMPESNAIDSLDFAWFIGTPHSQARWRLRSYAGGNGWGIQPVYANKTGKRHTTLSTSVDEGFDTRARIMSMIEKYAPESLRELDTMLEEYMGMEGQLLKNLILQYGPEPVDPSVSEFAQRERDVTCLLLNRADAGRLGAFQYDDRLRPISHTTAITTTSPKTGAPSTTSLSPTIVRNASLFGSDLCLMLGRDMDTIERKQAVYTSMLAEYERIMEWWYVPANEKRRKIKQERQVLLTCQSEVYFVLNSLMMTKFYTRAHSLLTDCNIFPRLNIMFGKVFFTEVTSNSRYYDDKNQQDITDEDAEEEEDANNSGAPGATTNGKNNNKQKRKKRVVKFITSVKKAFGEEVKAATEPVPVTLSITTAPSSPTVQSPIAVTADEPDHHHITVNGSKNFACVTPHANNAPSTSASTPTSSSTGSNNATTTTTTSNTSATATSFNAMWENCDTYDVVEKQLQLSENELFYLPSSDGKEQDFSDEEGDAEHRHDPDTLRKLEVLRVIHEYTNGQDRGEILTTIHDLGVTSCRFELAEKLTERILACNEDPCVETTCFHTIESYLRLFGFYQRDEPEVSSLNLLTAEEAANLPSTKTSGPATALSPPPPAPVAAAEVGEDGIPTAPSAGGVVAAAALVYPRVSDRFKNRTQMEICDKMMRHIMEDRVWNARSDRTTKPKSNDPHAQNTTIATSIYPPKRIDGYMGALGEMVKFNHDGMMWLEHYVNGSIPLPTPTEPGNYARREDDTLIKVFRKRLLQFASDHNLLIRLVVVTLMKGVSFPINYVRKDRFWEVEGGSSASSSSKPFRNSVGVNEDVLSLIQANCRRVMEPSSVLLSRLYFVRQMSRKFLNTLLTPFLLQPTSNNNPKKMKDSSEVAEKEDNGDEEANTIEKTKQDIIKSLPGILARYINILATFSPSAFEDCGDESLESVEGLEALISQCLQKDPPPIGSAAAQLGNMSLAPSVLSSLYTETGAPNSSMDGVGGIGSLGQVEVAATTDNNNNNTSSTKNNNDDAVTRLLTETPLEQAVKRLGRPLRCLYPVIYPEDTNLLAQKPATLTIKPLLRGGSSGVNNNKAPAATQDEKEDDDNTATTTSRTPILATSYVAVSFDNSPSAPHSYFVGPSPALIDQYRHAIDGSNTHYTNHNIDMSEKCPVLDKELFADPAMSIFTLVQNTQSIHPDEMESTERLCVITTSISLIMKAHAEDPQNGIDNILGRLAEIEFANRVKIELEDARRVRKAGDTTFKPSVESALTAALAVASPSSIDDATYETLSKSRAAASCTTTEGQKMWLSATQTNSRQFYDVARPENGMRDIAVPPMLQSTFLVNQRVKSLIISDDVANNEDGVIVTPDGHVGDMYGSCQPVPVPSTAAVEAIVYDVREYGLRDAMSTTDAFDDLFQKDDFFVKMFRILSTWLSHYCSSQRYVETVYVCTQVPFAEWKSLTMLIMGRLPYYFKHIQRVLLQQKLKEDEKESNNNKTTSSEE